MKRSTIDTLSDIFVLFLVICAGALAVGCIPTVRIYTETPGMEDAITDAGDVIGVKTKVVDEPGNGVVTMKFMERHDGKCGEAVEKFFRPKSVMDAVTGGILSCTPEAWACEDAKTFEYLVTVVAHELGHVFNLNHRGSLEDPRDVPQRDGLMHPSANSGATASDDQKLIVQGSVEAFNRVCR